MTCHGCGRPLSAPERKYYGFRCEGCERDWFDRIEAWRRGTPDAEFDAMYSVPKPVVH